MTGWPNSCLMKYISIACFKRLPMVNWSDKFHEERTRKPCWLARLYKSLTKRLRAPPESEPTFNLLLWNHTGGVDYSLPQRLHAHRARFHRLRSRLSTRLRHLHL